MLTASLKKLILSCSASYAVSPTDQDGTGLSICVREVQLSDLAEIPRVLAFLGVSLNLLSECRNSVLIPNYLPTIYDFIPQSKQRH
jgi:hypothetical protein